MELSELFTFTAPGFWVEFIAGGTAPLHLAFRIVPGSDRSNFTADLPLRVKEHGTAALCLTSAFSVNTALAADLG